MLRNFLARGLGPLIARSGRSSIPHASEGAAGRLASAPMSPAELDDDRQMRAMVALVEAQAEQLSILRNAVDSLEAKVALRSELDVIVAQDLRTPLSVVLDSLGELQILKPGDPDYPDVLDRATRNTQWLHDIVEDMLKPWRTEGPVIDRRSLESVGLTSLVEAALAAFSDDSSTARVKVADLSSLKVRTSPPRLTGILVNVIEHALRRSTGTVQIAAERGHDLPDGAGGPRNYLRITVTDDGAAYIGAQPDELFEPFSGENAIAGTSGIGLYLVRMLSRSLGGDIYLRNGDDGGGVAVLELPQNRIADGDPVLEIN